MEIIIIERCLSTKGFHTPTLSVAHGDAVTLKHLRLTYTTKLWTFSSYRRGALIFQQINEPLSWQKPALCWPPTTAGKPNSRGVIRLAIGKTLLLVRTRAYAQKSSAHAHLALFGIRMRSISIVSALFVPIDDTNPHTHFLFFIGWSQK